MDIILIWIAKLLQRLSRLLGNSGAALPGLFLERVSPKLLERRLSKLPAGAIVVSGTNGKTTTTKLITGGLEALGRRVFTNTTGSNMTRGLLSAVASQTRLFGSFPYDIAVLEIDEAYAALLAERIPVRGAVVLNVMRDQLDRFGEIDRTAELLASLTSRATDFVVLNADDTRVSGLPSNPGVRRRYYGLHINLKPLLRSEEEWHGSAAGAVTAKVPKPDVVLTKSKDDSLAFSIGRKQHSLTTKMTGIHNHSNIVAAATVLATLYPESLAEITDALGAIKPAFGRGEHVEYGRGSVDLLLIKNPSSFVTTLAATDVSAYDRVALVINDAYADGRDVSWLWDVDMGKLAGVSELWCGGTRAYDMAVRMKYEGKTVQKTDTKIKSFTDEVLHQKGSTALFCTYTAMLAIRKRLVVKQHVRQVH